ncbi:MAG TPA: hypothetical protein VEG60_11175 [Candidatus Binatia bacterium]|nr:hypothetical protein [Candidatus Binatia bacterium]
MTLKPRTLLDTKSFTDGLIDKLDQEGILRSGLGLIGLSGDWHERVIARWQVAGRPAVRHFAPYFRYVLSVDIFFYLAIGADLISRVRPSNKIDFAYLYYLPFSMVFASNDTLHSRVVPLFLRSYQTFVEGAALKEDLGKLDRYFSLFPEEIKNEGVFRFATYPPKEGSFLVTQLWDKYLPGWRKSESEREPLSRNTEIDIRKIEPDQKRRNSNRAAVRVHF